MNLDAILAALNHERVRYILIGGMNFLLRHEPTITYDVDVWIEDLPENLSKCETALGRLEASWGPTEKEWRPVEELEAGWLSRQGVFSLTSPHGAIDIFRSVRGLDDWRACFSRCMEGATADGTRYHGLADVDMLACQEALEKDLQKLDRIRTLRKALADEDGPP